MSRCPIVDEIAGRAAASPGRPAVVEPGGAVTFAQLREGIAGCAALLAALGGAEGGAVGLLLPNSARFVVALLGIASVRSAAILFPSTLTAEEVRQYCRDAGTRVVLSGPLHREVLEAAGGRVVGRGGAGVEAFGFDVPPAEWSAPGDFIGQLTSGADQPPKTAIRTHAAVHGEIQDFAGEIGLTDRDTVLVLPSIAHSYGLIGGTLAPLCRGGRVILPERFVPEEVVGLIQSERPTVLFAVPFMYRALVAAHMTGAADAASLRLCFSAGAPLSRDVDDGFARRFGRRICQDYGTTEAGVISVRLAWTERLRDSVGRPVRGRSVTIVDAGGHPLGPGEVGEVVVESSALARGYLAGPQAGTRIEGGRLSTGDLGWVSEDGDLFLTGRTSQRIRTADTVINAAEVEKVIAALPHVREVAVVGVPHPDKGTAVKAVVVADGLAAADIIEHCRRSLAGLQVPEIVEFRPALPRTPAGKILRRALRDPLQH